MIGVLWRLTRGYRLTPWRSPYLLWRIETYSGMAAHSITPARFFRFCWSNWPSLSRYLSWAERMR
jgi:hypothetical protein